MKIEVAGHFLEVAENAKRCRATVLSIQNLWTFVNFERHEDAQRFTQWCDNSGLKTMGINTQRPFVKFEVSVEHKL